MKYYLFHYSQKFPLVNEDKEAEMQKVMTEEGLLTVQNNITHESTMTCII